MKKNFLVFLIMTTNMLFFSCTSSSTAYHDSDMSDTAVDKKITSDSDTTDTGNSGNTANTGNSGDTANTGNTGNSGNTANTGNSGDTANTGNTGNSGNTANTGNSGDTANTGNTGNSGNTANTGDTGNTGNTADTGNSSAEGPCEDGSWYMNTHEGLEWSCKLLESKTQQEAAEYCESGGWRMPTIDELRLLLMNCSQTETGGSCNVTNTCIESSCRNDSCDGCGYDYMINYSEFVDSGSLWSASVLPDNTDMVWIVYFSTAAISKKQRNEPDLVRCVREPL